MTDLIYDYISQGVDMIINASILAAIVILLRNATVLSTVSAMQQANSDRLNYYRQYSMYDNTEGLSCADVASCLQYYRNDLCIVIDLGEKRYDTIRKCFGNRTSYKGKSLPSNGLHKVIVSNNRSTGKYVVQIDSDVFSGVPYDYVSALIGSTDTFTSKLYEDSKEPSGSSNEGANEANWKGGIINGIKFTKTGD